MKRDLIKRPGARAGERSFAAEWITAVTFRESDFQLSLLSENYVHQNNKLMDEVTDVRWFLGTTMSPICADRGGLEPRADRKLVIIMGVMLAMWWRRLRRRGQDEGFETGW